MIRNPKAFYKPLCKSLFSCYTKGHPWVFSLIPTMLKDHSVLYALWPSNTTIVYLKTGIHLMSYMCFIYLFHIFFFFLLLDGQTILLWRIIADQGFGFFIPGKHNMNEKKYRYSWICLKKMKIRMQIKEFLQV